MEKFIESRSKYWQKKGYLHHRNLEDGELVVTFAKHMLEWINPSYEGKMTMSKAVTTAPNQGGLVAKAEEAEEGEEEGEEEVGEEEEDDDDEPYYIATFCRKEVEAAAQDLILEQTMALPPNGSEEEVGPFDKTEAEAARTNTYLKDEEEVRAAVENMLSLQEKVVAWRQKWPVRQMSNAGDEEEQQEGQDRFTSESMIRAKAHDTITALDSTSLSPPGSVGGSSRHDIIYQDGKYPATYRNILLQQKGKGRCSSTASQARAGTPLRPTITSNTGPYSAQERMEDPTSHTTSPRTNKDRMAAKNVNLAKEILDDTLMADGGAIELRSRRQFGYVQQLLDMAQDNLPTGEDAGVED